MPSLSPASAVAAAQLAVAQAEAAAAVDVGAGEAAATLGVAQATEAYQLATQILKNKAVQLAPALIALEVLAINEGIAAYLAEQTAAAAVARLVQTAAESAFAGVQQAYETFARLDSSTYQDDLARDEQTLTAEPPGDLSAPGAVSGALEAARSGVSAALVRAG